MKTLFAVSYEIVTEESVEHGDAAERGFIDKNLSLRDAIKALHATRTNEVECSPYFPETDGTPVDRPRWVTVHNGMEYRTGEYESRSLHIPEKITRASARRIAKLAGVPGNRFK